MNLTELPKQQVTTLQMNGEQLRPLWEAFLDVPLAPLGKGDFPFWPPKWTSTTPLGADLLVPPPHLHMASMSAWRAVPHSALLSLSGTPDRLLRLVGSPTRQWDSSRYFPIPPEFDYEQTSGKQKAPDVLLAQRFAAHGAYFPWEWYWRTFLSTTRLLQPLLPGCGAPSPMRFYRLSAMKYMLVIPVLSYGWHPLRFFLRLRQALPPELDMHVTVGRLPLLPDIDIEHDVEIKPPIAGWTFYLPAGLALPLTFNMVTGEDHYWDVNSIFPCRRCHQETGGMDADAALCRVAPMCNNCIDDPTNPEYDRCLHCMRPFRLSFKVPKSEAIVKAHAHGYCTQFCEQLAGQGGDLPISVIPGDAHSSQRMQEAFAFG